MSTDNREKPEGASKETGSPDAGNDVDIARRMFTRAAWLIPPIVIASFTVTRPAYGQTCTPNLCEPGVCGPCVCNPGVPKPCGPCGQ